MAQLPTVAGRDAAVQTATDQVIIAVTVMRRVDAVMMSILVESNVANHGPVSVEQDNEAARTAVVDVTQSRQHTADDDTAINATTASRVITAAAGDGE
jgi:hypothetical protein